MSAETKDKEAYTVQEASKTYGVSPDVLRSHIKAGNLAVKYPSSRPIIGADELRNWFNALPDEAPL